MKPDLGKCKKMLESGISLLCVGENKVPNFPWKKYQTEAYTKESFSKDYAYSGGTLRKDGSEIPGTHGIGIITGFNGLEVFDIDLKILPSLKEQQDFWNEYTLFLKDNISDFDSKFVIYKTLNNGYHILYRCATIQGNTKIAKLKDHKEAIIETRGAGGYVFVYDNQVSKKSYCEIQEISELDRQVLFEVSRFYNYVEESVKDSEIPHEVKKESAGIETPVWIDYNEKTSVLDLLSDEFNTIRQLSDKYIIKRHGAKSAHSGYVYKNSGCMYLFSTGTNYPNEKLLSPFAVYTYKYHNGNFSSAAKDLYQKGYGSRVIKKLEHFPKIEIPKEDLIFPIDIFPEQIKDYILLCNQTLDSSIDYMGCSFLWMLSVIIGNSIKVQVKTGWIETASIWVSAVGNAGVGKTPSISNIIFPLMKANNREIKNYIKHSEKYSMFMDLDKKEREQTEEVKKPRKTQFIVNDITLEALVELHEECKNSVGVFKDELAGWFKDMNKYRSGSDLEFWLSSWSGKSVSLNRKTAKSSFVEAPFIPVLGGIQPGILDAFYSDENKDNGFIDRMLLCFPDLSVEYYNDNEMDKSWLDWYNDYVIAFYDNIKHKATNYSIDDEIEPIISEFGAEAHEEWKRVFNNITKNQNSDEENEYMKSMLPKQKAYIPRFALLINCLEVFNRGGSVEEFKLISKKSMLAAEKLSNYFICMAQKIKINTVEVNDIKTIIKTGNKSTKEKFAEIYKQNPDINKTKVAEILGISRRQLHRYINDMAEMQV